jgi:hypothetical protein
MSFRRDHRKEPKLRDDVVAPRQIDWTAGFPLKVGNLSYGLVEASPETKEYWEGVANDVLLLKKCLGCGRHLHPRRLACPDDYVAGVEWVKASGKGEVYSFSTIYRAPSPELQASAPYCVGIVLLREGVHLFTRFLYDSGTEPEIRDPVHVEFRLLEGGQKLPVFAPGAGV